MVVFAVDRFFTHVRQCVVHPAHVPLIGEPQSAQVNRARYSRPGSRFFGERSCSVRMNLCIELAQERYSFEVFIAAMFVRYPLVRFARVVQIKHRRDGVDTNTVDVKFIDPVQRTADQVVNHFSTPEVEDQRAPVCVFAFARILMFVQRCTVKLSQPMFIFWKVRRHPVDDDSYAGIVTTVDEVSKVIGVPETLRWGEHANGLVAPGAIERMLRYRQQLNVREPHISNIVDKLICELPVCKIAIALIRLAPP